ncbi:hypothetical protein [Mesorhizobium sp. CO1-1-9]|uniref:hypothetical protein n=1 Tax=Mesorhizobium sp. CO1-1-9 TaxID=2876630 RepID=UPI001CCA6F93|nr:hypothetical protein [Mesorhizobium sp. CO1-1-9]MBZ9695504.1 hypothetical protein [Mesorhizobium sp. CO1-1-9]
MSITAKLTGMVKATRNAAAEVTNGLESVRVQIIALKDKRSHLEVAPVPKAEALQRLDAFAAFVNGRASRMISPRDFTTREGYRMPALSVHSLSSGDLALGFVAALLREQLAAAIDREYAAGDGPTADAHRQMLAKLDVEILDLEMVEESLVRAAEAAGIEILRRGDADPRAVMAPDNSLPS